MEYRRIMSAEKTSKQCFVLLKICLRVHQGLDNMIKLLGRLRIGEMKILEMHAYCHTPTGIQHKTKLFDEGLK